MKLNFNENHVKWGVTAFSVIVGAMLIFFIIFRFEKFTTALDMVVAVLMPFIYGLIFAYLLCPVYNFTVRNVYALLSRNRRPMRRALTIAKGIATIVALILFLVVIAGVLWMIIPGLIDSIMHIVEILPGSMSHFIGWMDAKTVNYPQVQSMINGWVNEITVNIVDYVEKTILPQYMDIATSISTGVFGILNGVKNFFVAIIICVYFLNSKDLFAAQSRKLILSLFSAERAHEILKGAAFTNKTFGGFINGKLIDSLIVGVICFIVMSILNWEYPLLISCIIGLTNIIPFFGPFIGAIPSALLILMVDSRQCIYFLIFVLILQQLDGNVIGPKILGDSTGLSSFWVMFAILVGGGLFGFAGMIVGIPIFAVLYAYFCRGVNRKLEKKGFSVDIRDYKIDRYRSKPKKEKRKNDHKRIIR